MANTFYWDLGFDFNASLNPPGNTNSQHFLADGLVLVQSGGNVPANPAGIAVGDSIGFNAFNITTPLPGGTFTIQSGTIAISNADGSQPASPFVDSKGNCITSLSIPNTPVPVSGTGMSTIFSGIQAPQASQSSSAAKFPIYNCITPQKVANSGRFLMSFTLNVQGPSNSATFYDDPEMIVEGPAGAPIIRRDAAQRGRRGRREVL